MTSRFRKVLAALVATMAVTASPSAASPRRPAPAPTPPRCITRSTTRSTTRTAFRSTTAATMTPTTTAARAMVTATSRRLAAVAFLALAAALAIAGCGGAGARPAWARQPPFSGRIRLVESGRAADRLDARAASLRAGVARLPARLETDRERSRHGVRRADGRARAHPRLPERDAASGQETLADWAKFRPAHNADEGDMHVVTEAAARGLRFRTGSGSCVIDRYATTSARYREIACLVHGSRGYRSGAARPCRVTGRGSARCSSERSRASLPDQVARAAAACPPRCAAARDHVKGARDLVAGQALAAVRDELELVRAPPSSTTNAVTSSPHSGPAGPPPRPRPPPGAPPAPTPPRRTRRSRRR